MMVDYSFLVGIGMKHKKIGVKVPDLYIQITLDDLSLKCALALMDCAFVRLSNL